DPYGNGTPNEDPDGNGLALNFNLRFSEGYYDAETGLIQMGFRDYSPEKGGFIESDPIGLDGGSMSTYAYVNDNPIGYVDPDGLSASPNWWPTPTPNMTPAPPMTPMPSGFPANAPRYGTPGAGLLGRCLGMIGLLLTPGSNPGGQCSDFNYQPGKEDICEDGKCREALSDARRAYNELVIKRIPQYMYGVRHGMDDGSPGHYKAILETQRTLQDAIRRVMLYCKSIPSDEMEKWERVANQQFPIRH
ncbi:MAG: RHS repeat-associated core domain-containing protein, partial [Steroidobacter sp.]